MLKWLGPYWAATLPTLMFPRPHACTTALWPSFVTSVHIKSRNHLGVKFWLFYKYWMYFSQKFVISLWKLIPLQSFEWKDESSPPPIFKMLPENHAYLSAQQNACMKGLRITWYLGKFPLAHFTLSNPIFKGSNKIVWGKMGRGKMWISFVKVMNHRFYPNIETHW